MATHEALISHRQNANKMINCRQEARKSLDSLNTIIYEPIQSDDTVICVAIMRVIIIINEKDFILNSCKLIVFGLERS